MAGETSVEARKPVRMDALEISTWKTGAWSRETWAACLREYDEGSRVFTGATQREAVDELLDYYEQDDGELHE